jgi:exo-poly-alpha-galacturonosidase
MTSRSSLARHLTIAAVVLLAPLAVPTSAGATGDQPAAPVDVRVPTLAFDEQSITLAWEKPAAHADIVDYHVYLDGRLLGSSSQGSGSPAKPYIDAFYADPANSRQVKVVMNTFTATGLRPDTRYRFTVRSVDAAGHESRDSDQVSQSTTPVPKVFNIADYGAVGDGTTLNTAAIQAAIDACTPGGKVLVPAGVFSTGAIFLKSDMTLEVAEGATLLGSPNADDYPWNFKLYDYSTDTRFYSLINAHTYDYGTLRNIRIVGKGTIDGNGWKQNGFDAEGFPVSATSSSSTVSTNGILAANQVVKAAQLGSPAPYPTRSNLITLRGVENVYYGGFTALNPSNHTLVNLRDRNVTINGVKLLTFNVNNADGVEFGNSNGLTVINNVFDTGDDDMNFAAGLGAASVDNPPSQNAWIANNYFRKGHGAIVEGSHTGAWIQNIVAEDNVINGTDVGLRMKTDPNNGGGSRHVLFRDNALKNIGQQAFIFTSAYSDPNAAIVVEPAPNKAQFRDVQVENVTVDGTGRESINVIGVFDQPHTDLHFDNVRFLNAKPTSIDWLTNTTFNNVVFDNTPNPWVVKDSTGLSFTGTTTVTGVSTDATAGPSWSAGSALAASTVDDVSATLSWPAASDNVAVASYQVFSGDTVVATVPGTALSARVTGLSPARAYHFRVEALDATGNATSSGPSADVTTTGTPDTVAPVAGSSVSVRAGSVGTTWLRLDWAAASDTFGVAAYRLSANGTTIATVPGNALTYVVPALKAGTAYTFGVTAVDAAGNATPYTATASATTNPAYDTGAPVWPRRSGIRISQVGSTSVALSWPAASDDQQVIGYRVYVNGVPVTTGEAFTPINGASTVTGTAYTVTGLKPGTLYTFTVEAGDSAFKWTGSGPSVVIRTRH